MHYKNKDFFGFYEKVEPYTILGEDKTYNIWQFANQTKHLTGSMAELGVYKGGLSKLLKLVNPEKMLYMFDTFGTGIPENTPSIDYHKKGDFRGVELDKIESLFATEDKVRFCVGVFPETVTKEIACDTFSLVHLDADQYLSTKNGLEFFYPRMTVGGIIVLDDWEWQHCPGVKKAAIEFLEDKPESVIQVSDNQAIIIKIMV